LSKLTDYSALTSPHTDDVLMIVDTHDTTMSAAGTTKKITVANLSSSGSSGAVQNVSAGSGTVTLNAATYGAVVLTLTGNSVTLALSGATAGTEASITLYTVQSGGPWSVTWPAVTWAGGTTPTVPASGTGIFVFSSPDGGTTWYGAEVSAPLTLPMTIAQGGTGQTTQQAAMDALAGAQTSGQFLRGNGTHVVMGGIQAADVPVLNQNTTGKAAAADALNSATTTVNVAAATAPTAGQVLTATSGTAATWQAAAGGVNGVQTVSAGSGTVTLNASLYAAVLLTLTGGSVTLALSGASGGTEAQIILYTVQSGGPWTLTWPTVTWVGGSAPSVPASGTGIFTFSSPDGGTTWYGAQVTAAPSLPLSVSNGGTGLASAGVAGTFLASTGLSTAASWTGLLPPTAPQTSSFTATLGKLNEADATSANITATLPVGGFSGQLACVKMTNTASSHTTTIAVTAPDVMGRATGWTSGSYATSSSPMVLTGQAQLMAYNAAGTASPVTVTASSANLTISTSTAPFAAGQLVYFTWTTQPTGLNASTPYYVVSTSGPTAGVFTFSVDTTSGGSGIAPSTAGSGVLVQTCGNWTTVADDLPLSQLDLRYPADSAVVHLAGTETITGAKTFNVPPNLATQSVSAAATLAAASAPVVLTDTTTAAFTLTLPGTPVAGEFFVVVDDTGQWNTHNLTIGRNGKNIDGAASNLTLANQWGKLWLYYDGTAWWTLSAGASNETPVVNGTAAAGTRTSYSRSDHVHPTDTSRLAATTTLDAITAPAADVSLNSHKATNLANGSASGDAVAFGQINSKLAATAVAGVSLGNSTPTLISWTAPNDGAMHRVTVYIVGHVTSTATGGRIDLSVTLPDGTANTKTAIGNSQAAGVYYPPSQTCPQALLLEANTTISVLQGTALTGGASTVWAEIWGS
jgi:hypothetical protein